MPWVRTRRLRQLANEAEALGRKRLSSDKGWPRKRAARQHDMLDEIELELRKFRDRKSARSLHTLTKNWLRKVETASGVWAGYSIARDALRQRHEADEGARAVVSVPGVPRGVVVAVGVRMRIIKDATAFGC